MRKLFVEIKRERSSMNYSRLLTYFIFDLLNIFQYFKTNNNRWFIWISLVWFSSSNRSLFHIWGRRIGWKKPKWNDRRYVRGKKHREKRERLFLTFCQSFSLSFCTFWNTLRSSRSNSSDVSTSSSSWNSCLNYWKYCESEIILKYVSLSQMILSHDISYILNGIREQDDSKFSSSMLFCRHW